MRLGLKVSSFIMTASNSTQTRTGTALVTGASSGIGEAIARQLAQVRHNVILVARNEAKLRNIAQELSRQFAVRADIVAMDLVSADAARALVRDLDGADVDLLINNAGYGLHGEFVDMDEAKLIGMLQLNVVSLTHLTRLLLPGMLRRRRGRILNVASTAGFQPGPFMAVYCATKAYVLSFSEALYSELAGSGVTVTTLCPGATRTGFDATANASKIKLFQSRGVMDAETVARLAIHGLLAGRRLVIPGLTNRLMAHSVGVMPRGLVLRVSRSLFSPAHG
jgi:short-subunit dehydrogenase